MRWRPVLVVTGVVVLLAAGVAVSDLSLRIAAEQRIAGSVRDALGAGEGARVEISRDRPFLLQVAGGRLDEVTVSADHLTLDGSDVTDVRMEATGVTVRAPYTADAATVTGTVPPSAVRERLAENGLDVDVAVAGDDLRASGSVLSVPWGVVLTPRADDGRLAVDVASADIAGVSVGVDALPAPVKQALTGLDVPVSGLPDGLAVTGAQVVEGGVRVTLTGHDVVLPGS